MTLTRTEAAELVARLRELLAKATPGLWRIYHSGAPRTISADYGDTHCILAHTSAGKRAWAAASHGEANAALIVKAVNALPALLDFIEQHLEPAAEPSATAREMLAAEYRKAGLHFAADEIVTGEYRDASDFDVAVRAIERALQSRPTGRAEALEKAAASRSTFHHRTARQRRGAEEMTFRDELQALINRHSQENGSDTPDWILAHFLHGCLLHFNGAVNERERWYGRKEGEPEQYLVAPEPHP